MSDAHPDYVKCIAHTREEKLGESWCGRALSNEWHFTSIEHAIYNALDGGRLVACPACIEAVRRALIVARGEG